MENRNQKIVIWYSPDRQCYMAGSISGYRFEKQNSVAPPVFYCALAKRLIHVAKKVVNELNLARRYKIAC